MSRRGSCPWPRSLTVASLLTAAALLPSSLSAFNPNTDLKPVLHHPGGVNYYSNAVFANGLAHDGRNWRDVATNTTIPRTSNQISLDGNPLYLDPGQILRAEVGYGGGPGYHKPANWPDRTLYNGHNMFAGQVVLEWQGRADIRVVGGGSTLKSGSASGLVTNGRRVYTTTGRFNVEIHGVDSSNPPTQIRAWLPDPDNWNNASLEDEVFHPIYLDRLQDRDWGAIRYMNWHVTNASPQQDWVDRRRPTDTFQAGVINPRNPAPGSVLYYRNDGSPVFASDKRSTGVAYEYQVLLSNLTNNDIWVTIPHLATDDYIRKVARLIRYGSNGVNPYTSNQSNPVYPPLNANLKVYVEFSNEIWAGNNSFPQGNWASDRASEQGISTAQFNARQFSRTWDIFEQVLGTSRVIRTAAVFTASENYTSSFIDEFYNNSSLLEPEILSVTTYFGNGIQFWALDNVSLPGGSTPWTSSYWTGAQIEDDLDELYDVWMRYVLAGFGYDGNTGRDNVAVSGGFRAYVRDISQQRNLPIVAYEGGPSIYTDGVDGGAPEDDSITLFMETMNRHPHFADVYRVHLNQAFERGLRAHSMFTDISQWGKFGQWGHLEYLGQDLNEAIKYKFILDFIDEFQSIRSIHNPQGAVPSFTTPAELPRAEVGTSYSQQLQASGGNGALSYDLIGAFLVPGMTFNAGNRTISGSPTENGVCYVYLRVIDADGDPAWRTFTVQCLARSTDPEVTINFAGLTTSASPIAEPLTIGAYQFTSTGASAGAALMLQDENGPGWPTGWESTILRGKNWNSRQLLERTNGNAFDLTRVDLAMFQGDSVTNQGSVRIVGTTLNGDLLEEIYNLDLQKVPMTTVEPDMVGLRSLEFYWYEKRDAQGAARFGAIDNLVINGTPSGSSGGSGSGGEGPRFQAENASVTGATILSGGNAEGSGYVDYLAAGDAIEFTNVNVSTAGPTTMTLRYANGRSYGSAIDLYVNGTFVQTIWGLDPTGGWTTWTDKNVSVNLNAGTNTIGLHARYSHSPSVDYIEIPGASGGSGGGGSGAGNGGGSAEGPLYEAENADLTGVLQATGGGANGGGYADFQNAGDTIEFDSVDLASAGNVTMTLRYANGRSYASAIDLHVNGTFVRTIWGLDPTGGWTTWTDKNVSVNLNAGTNVITLEARYSHSPNVDYIEIPGGS
ncbi:MAG: carbohydrate-binding protein [Opitutales bacterium]